jgi:hypothetical protein
VATVLLRLGLAEPIDIFGKWRGRKYNFVTCYRSGFS